jgi:hypothetical protein
MLIRLGYNTLCGFEYSLGTQYNNSAQQALAEVAENPTYPDDKN